MALEIKITDDGSKTLFLTEMNETYHSKFGAINESEHVFLTAGFDWKQQKKVSILEVGMGTGLNVFLTYLHSRSAKKEVYYESIEKFPLSSDIYEALNYAKDASEQAVFDQIHQSEWEASVQLDSTFVLKKRQIDLLDYQSDKCFDIIYFDAFDPAKQPELWTEKVFKNMFKLLNDKGILVTYSAKGIVRRAMQAAGFVVERLQGPPGKREMMRAVKQV